MDNHGEPLTPMVETQYNLSQKFDQLEKQTFDGHQVLDRSSPYFASTLQRPLGVMEQQSLSSILTSSLNRPPCFPLAFFYSQPHAYPFLTSPATSANLSTGFPHYDISRQVALLNSAPGGAFYPVGTVKSDFSSASMNIDLKDGTISNLITKESKLMQWSQCHPSSPSRCHSASSAITPQKVLDLRSPEAIGRDHSNKTVCLTLSPGSDVELSSKPLNGTEGNLTPNSWSRGQPYCPVCGITLQPHELEEHVQVEIESLEEFYRQVKVAFNPLV
ncbi:uncharacterized protein LOC143245614 [Tachypleus tridentatus]|uniref:uncharacterized protein LOC143245614 n=1 Tax=Tachypleus tridentatus TaxID=6853 RepID=UPI003FD24D77